MIPEELEACILAARAQEQAPFYGQRHDPVPRQLLNTFLICRWPHDPWRIGGLYSGGKGPEQAPFYGQRHGRVHRARSLWRFREGGRKKLKKCHTKTQEIAAFP
jgi:hypothetical protein